MRTPAWLPTHTPPRLTSAARRTGWRLPVAPRPAGWWRPPSVLARGVLLAVLVGFVGVVPADGGASAEPAGLSPRQPNVVVVMTDDQTVESMRVMQRTRRLLGAGGLTFANSFVSYPLCCPSRATLLTGQYSHNHGVESNAPPSGGYAKLDHANTLPVWLQQVGYHTAHIGKYLNGYGTLNPTEVPPGWSEWYATVDPSTYDFYGYTVNENGTLKTYGQAPADYQTDVHTRRAVDVITRQVGSDQPLYLSVAYLAPHADAPDGHDDNGHLPDPAPRHQGAFADEPLPRPPSFNEPDVADKPAFIRALPPLGQQRIRQVERNYRARLASLLAVDEGVAAIVGALERTGRLDDTYLVFTADNGFFHGEHRIPTSKFLLYEESARVPLLLRGPGITPGTTATGKVANIDLAPTVVALTGAQAGRPMDGRPLVPFFTDPGVRWQRELLIETGGGGSGNVVQAPTYTAIRTDRFLYAEHSTGEQELYDLAEDPFQLTSRHAHPAWQPTRATLAARLARLRTCAARTCQ
jgi:N-acetylglucosamine-6-sulfatase